MKRYIAFVVVISLLFAFQVASPSANSSENLRMDKSSDVSTDSFEKEALNTIKKKSHWFGTMVLVTLGAAAVGAAIYFLVIKKPEYKLTVTATQGVAGSPAPGAYTYKKGTKVSYNFTANPGYSSLTVILDGTVVSNSGTITMNGNHTLSTTALEKGKYTSITLQIHFFIKGMNTGGDVSVYFEKKKFLSKSFYTTKTGDANSKCEDGELMIDETQIWTIDKPSIYCSQLYYYGCVNKSYPFFICPEIQITVISYQWETGKADPGSPIIKNPQDIVFDKSKMCLTLPTGSINCESQVTLEFVPPANPQNAQQVFVASPCGSH